MGVSSAEVGFGAGGVTLGESTVRNLVLSNRGALEVEYRLEGEDEAAVQVSRPSNISSTVLPVGSIVEGCASCWLFPCVFGKDQLVALS